MKLKEIKPGMVIHCPKEEDVCRVKGQFIHVGEKAGWCPLKPMLDDMEGNND